MRVLFNQLIVVAAIVLAGQSRKFRLKANDLTEKITTPKQFELIGKIYRCYHFPEVKDKE